MGRGGSIAVEAADHLARDLPARTERSILIDDVEQHEFAGAGLVVLPGHDFSLPLMDVGGVRHRAGLTRPRGCRTRSNAVRSEEHTSELQSLIRISYAFFCLKKQTYCELT